MSSYDNICGIVNTHARYYPSPVGEYVVLTVLKLDTMNNYRCYSAIVPDVSVDDPNYLQYQGWVAFYGTKLSYDAARKEFPALPENRYAN